MGKAIPTQHPAVVLRSQFRQVRALLAIAMIAVVGLTVAVVILANDSDDVGSTSSAKPIESIEYGGFNPATGRPESAPLPQQAQQLQTGSRYGGGPEEGTTSAREQDLRHLRAGGDIPAQPLQAGSRYDGGPEEGTADVTPAQADTKDYSKNGATGDYAQGPLPPDAPAKDHSKNAATGD